ncbi:MAG: serine/threonine-protein kinase [Planctomycetota bacterium]
MSTGDSPAAGGDAPKKKKRKLKLPGFRLGRVLGRGAQGMVVKAQRERDGLTVAIKLLSPSMAKVSEFRRRFRREAQVAMELDHKNIVQGIEVGAADGIPFVVMEYIEGHTLTDLLKAGPLGEEKALPIIRGVAEALQCAHKRGLVHRDIKPDNIMIESDGTPKLMDLGLAKETTTGDELTMSGSVFGTPGYISPEAAVDSKDTDIRADIYSLGSTFYHAVVGEVPFPEKTLTKSLQRALTEDPVPPAERVEVTEACSELIMKMLARDRKNRVQTPDELIIDLDLVAKGDMPTRPQGHEARRTKKQKPRQAGGGTGESGKRPWWRILWPFGK